MPAKRAVLCCAGASAAYYYSRRLRDMRHAF